MRVGFIEEIYEKYEGKKQPQQFFRLRKKHYTEIVIEFLTY